MKKSKKLLSLFAALAMVSQVGISTPLVMAEDSVVEETPATTKLGLIHTFDGVEGDWTIPTGLAENVVPAVSYSEEGVEPNYATFSATGAWNGNDSDSSSPYVLADLGDDKIKFEDDKTIVFETRLKFTGLEESLNRIKIGYNLPASDITKFKLYDKVNANASFDYRSNMGDSHLFEFIDEADKFTYIRYGVGNYWSSAGTWTASETEPVDGQWLKVVVHVNPNFVFDYYLYDEDGNKLFEKTAQAMNYVTNSEYFENVALIMTHNEYKATTDVDYVKVYNVPTELADNYAAFNTSFDEVTVSDIKVDGVAIDELKEATEGNIEITADGEVGVKRVYYVDLLGDATQFEVEDYVYENNTITFPNGLVENAEYTVVLDLGQGVIEKSFTFASEWNGKVGLIYNQEAETNTSWYPNNSAYLSVADGAADGFVKYVTGEYSWAGKVGALNIPLADKKIKFENDKIIVLETKLNVKRPDGAAGRFGIYYNMEHQITDEGVVKDGSIAKNHSFLAGLYDNAAGNGFQTIYVQGTTQSAGETSGAQTSVKWPTAIAGYTLDGTAVYKLVIKLDKEENSLVYEVYLCNEDGSETLVATQTSTDLGWVTVNDFLTSVTLGNMSNKVESFEVDYLKVWNMPKGTEDYYQRFDKAYDELDWTNPIGLVLDLDGTENDAWVAATGATGTVANGVDEDGTTYARMSGAAANDYMYANLPGEGLYYKDNETIIIDTRVRGTVISSSNDARLQIKWNMPAEKNANFNLKYNGPEDLTGASSIFGDIETGFKTAYSYGANHLAIGEIAKTWLRFSNGNPPKNANSDNRFQNNWKSVNAADGLQDNKWFRVLIKMNKGFNMEYVVYNEANEVVYNETGRIHWIEQSNFLKNIAMFSFLKPMTSLDVDYLKIYNIEKGTEDNFKINGTIDGVDIREVKRVDVNKAEITVETEYDVNKASVSYTAWDGTAETLVNGEDYTVTEVGNNKYEIEFKDALKRSASYTIDAGENAKFGFETELDPATLYYDGFANATSLEDWKMIYSWSGAIDGFPDSNYVPNDYERIEVQDGNLVVIGDSEADIINNHPDRYGKLAASKMYEYQNGKDWKDYEFKFTYKTDLETQLNVVARHKTSLDPKNGIVSHGASTRHYVKYGKGGTERLYFGNMTGSHPQPMQGGSNVAEYDKVFNNTEKYPELTGSQRKYETTLQLGNRYETTIKVLGDTQYFSVEGLDDDLFYESAPNGEMTAIEYPSSQTAGSIAITNGTNNLMIDNITVLDLGLAFTIDGNTKAVTNDGINLVFTKEIASTDGIVVKNADGEAVPFAAVLADDNKTVTLKVAAIAGEYTVEVAGMTAVDGTTMQEEKSFKMITTEGSAYSMEVVTEEGTATCTISHPEVLAGAKLYIATYDANGALVSVDSEEIVSTTTTVTVEKANTVKTFLWNNMKPINY